MMFGVMVGVIDCGRVLVMFSMLRFFVMLLGFGSIFVVRVRLIERNDLVLRLMIVCVMMMVVMLGVMVRMIRLIIMMILVMVMKGWCLLILLERKLLSGEEIVIVVIEVRLVVRMMLMVFCLLRLNLVIR